MLLVAVTVLFCLLQILLWIDLNKSRRTHSDQVTVEPRSMFREILVDTADPIVLMLMGPFLKFTRQVSGSGYMASFYTTEMDHRTSRRRRQRPTSRRSSSSTPALWVTARSLKLSSDISRFKEEVLILMTWSSQERFFGHPEETLPLYSDELDNFKYICKISNKEHNISQYHIQVPHFT